MQNILNSNKTTKESEIIMNQIVFSAGFVQANNFCSLLCILLPILFVWYQKRKNGVKPGAFFIGAAFCLLFSYVATTIVNVLIFSIPGLLSFFSAKNHPVYSALFGAFSLGILSTIGAFIGLKYAMKKRPGKENALIFGVGINLPKAVVEIKFRYRLHHKHYCSITD